MNSSYITSAQKAEQLPQYDLPEIAMIGRSNCGKSTLINALLQRKNLARTSRTPGRTQMVNFFSVNDKLIFADLPGYGFSQTHRDLRQFWKDLMTTYLKRKNISYVLFLFDSRREMVEEDWQLLTWLAKSHQIKMVLTKTDKLNRSETQQKKNKVLSECEANNIKLEALHAVSVLKSSGITELRDELCLASDKSLAH